MIRKFNNKQLKYEFNILMTVVIILFSLFFLNSINQNNPTEALYRRLAHDDLRWNDLIHYYTE